jgi:hypothetical protein
MRKVVTSCLIGALVTAVILLAATSSTVRNAPGLKVTLLDLPTPVGSLVPQLTPLASGDIALTWQEPLAGGGYSFRMAVRHGGVWSAPRVIASGADLSMFTADLPGVVENPAGSLVAFWEIKDRRSSNHVDTLIRIAGSSDLGRTWSAPVQPHKNVSSGEHSFIAAFPAGRNTGLVWLDSKDPPPADSVHSSGMRGMEHTGSAGGRIGLRYVAVGPDRKVAEDAFIDSITCECCPNSAAATSLGPVVVYRGRESVAGARNAIRDIHISRLENGHWTKPHTVFADRWEIDACPDNGPAVEARDRDVAVAWWTRAGDHRKVQIAFSRDAGDTFSPPVRVDSGDGEGQVTLAWIPGRDAAVVGWLEGHKVWARIVTPTGELGRPVAVAASPGHSRLPRWIWHDNGILATYTMDVGGDRRAVRMARLTPEP